MLLERKRREDAERRRQEEELERTLEENKRKVGARWVDMRMAGRRTEITRRKQANSRCCLQAESSYSISQAPGRVQWRTAPLLCSCELLFISFFENYRWRKRSARQRRQQQSSKGCPGPAASQCDVNR